MGCFSHCWVEGADYLIRVCIFIIHDGERCRLPTFRNLEGFKHFGISQLFEVKLESCVFLLADSFQVVVVTSMPAAGKLPGLNYCKVQDYLTYCELYSHNSTIPISRIHCPNPYDGVNKVINDER